MLPGKLIPQALWGDLGEQMFAYKFKVVLSLNHQGLKFKSLNAEALWTKAKDYISLYLLFRQISHRLVLVARKFCTSYLCL